MDFGLNKSKPTQQQQPKQLYITWLVSATVDILHLTEVIHDCFPFIVDVVKPR